MELVEDWWEDLINPITGWRIKAGASRKQQKKWNQTRKDGKPNRNLNRNDNHLGTRNPGL